MMGLRRTISLSLIGIGIAGVLLYGMDRSWNLIIGPTISIEEPKNGSTLSESLVEIKGEAKNVTFITMNGRQIYVDNEGNIKEQLLLSRGYNIIVISGRDRFGRVEEERLELIYQ